MAIYCRISYDKTGQEMGVERQEQACRALAESRGWTVTEVYRDNSVSAMSRKPRPAFERMLADKPTTILMWSVDRLMRRMADLQRLIEMKVDVYSVQAGRLDLLTASGRANASFMVTMATFESEMKAERQVAANRQRLDKGLPLWGEEPFGFTRDGQHKPEEVEAIREGYRMLEQGYSMQKVADMLNERGFTTKRGNAWSNSATSLMMKHPRNAGLLVSSALPGEGEMKGSWDPIIDPEDWRRIMATFSHKNLVGKGQGKRSSLLSGLARCGKCGGPMNRNRTSRTGEPTYMCIKGHVSVPLEQLDVAVVMTMLETLSVPSGGPQVDQERQDYLRAERASLEEHLAMLTGMLANREMDRASYVQASSTVREQIKEIDGKLGAADVDLRPAYLDEALRMARLFPFNDIELPQKRSLIEGSFSEILVLPKKPGTKFNAFQHLTLRNLSGEELRVVTNVKTWHEANLVGWLPDRS